MIKLSYVHETQYSSPIQFYETFYKSV